MASSESTTASSRGSMALASPASQLTVATRRPLAMLRPPRRVGGRARSTRCWPTTPRHANADADACTDDIVSAATWASRGLRALRTTVTEAIEPLRRDKVIGSSLQAEVVVPVGAPEGDLAELFITAHVTRGQGDAVEIVPTSHHKCGRCWRHLPEVTEDGALCARCEDVVAGIDA